MLKTNHVISLEGQVTIKNKQKNGQSKVMRHHQNVPPCYGYRQERAVHLKGDWAGLG